MLPMIYDISMGVRRGDDTLRAELNAALAKHRPEIDAILAEYGVPRVDSAGSLDAMNRLLAASLWSCCRAPARGCDREERDPRPNARRDADEQPVAVTTLEPGGERPSPTTPKAQRFAANAFHLSEGKRLFAWFNCSGCHANGGGGMGPALIDDKWIYGKRIESIHATIRDGRPNGMPSFRQQGPGRPDLGTCRLCPLDGRPRILSGVARAQRRHDGASVREPAAGCRLGGQVAVRPPRRGSADPCCCRCLPDAPAGSRRSIRKDRPRTSWRG